MAEETITYTRKKKNQKNPPKPIEGLEPIKEEDVVVISKNKAQSILPKKELSEKQKANIERLVAINKERKLKREQEAKEKAEAEAKAKLEAEQKEKEELAKQGLRKVKYIIKPRKKREKKEIPKEKEEQKQISHVKPNVSFQAEKDDYPSDTDESDEDTESPPSDTTDTKQIKRKVQKIKQLENAITQTKTNPYDSLLKRFF